MYKNIDNRNVYIYIYAEKWATHSGAKHYSVQQNCVPLSRKRNYSITQIPKHAFEPLALPRRGLFSMNDSRKLLFAHAQSLSHADAKLRIPHAVAILATARSRHPLSTRPYPPPAFVTRRNSRLRARGPLSECINFSPFVLGPSDIPCAAAAIAI